MVRRRTAGRLLVGVLAVAVWASLAAGPGAVAARASCVVSPPLGEAVRAGEVVFVGTVTRVDNGGRWATVRVEERWRSVAPLPDVVEVRGGPEAGAATSVDRVYAPGRFLFVVAPGPGYLADNACTATRPWSNDLAVLRPTGVQPAPEVVADAPPSLLDQVDAIPVVALVVALLISVTAYLFILRARRRPPDWMR
jgi:hypothetical protein